MILAFDGPVEELPVLALCHVSLCTESVLHEADSTGVHAVARYASLTGS